MLPLKNVDALFARPGPSALESVEWVSSLALVVSIPVNWPRANPSDAATEAIYLAFGRKYGTLFSPLAHAVVAEINERRLRRASSETAYRVFERALERLFDEGSYFRLNATDGRKNRRGYIQPRDKVLMLMPRNSEAEEVDSDVRVNVPLPPSRVLHQPQNPASLLHHSDCGVPVLTPVFELATRYRVIFGGHDMERMSMMGAFTAMQDARTALAYFILVLEELGATVDNQLRVWALRASFLQHALYHAEHGKPPPRGPRDPERVLIRHRQRHARELWNKGLTFTAHEQPAVLKQLARKPIDAARRQVIEDNGYLAGQGYDPGQPRNVMPILKLESLFHLFPKPHLERYSSNGSERSFNFKVGDDKLARKAKTAIVRGDGMVVARLMLLNTLLPPQLGDTNIFDVELRFSTTTWPWRLWSHEPPHEELWVKELAQEAGREDATRWLKRSLASKPKALEYSGFYELQRAQAAMGFTLGRRQFLPPIQELLNEVVKELELGARDRTALSQFTDHYIACEEAERSFFEAVGGMKVVVGPSKVHGYMHNGGPSWRNVNVLMNLALKNAFAVRASAVPPTDEELGA
jgi:hypothetical protein